MNTQEIIKFAKDNWLKAVIAIVVAIVLYFVIRKAIEKIREGSDNRRARKEAAQMSVAIVNAGGKKPELSAAQHKAIAQQINNAIKGAGTKEEELAAAIKSIPTAADYYRVKSEYFDEYEADMWDEIRDDIAKGGSFLNYLPGFQLFADNDAVFYGELTTYLTRLGVTEEY